MVIPPSMMGILKKTGEDKLLLPGNSAIVTFLGWWSVTLSRAKSKWPPTIGDQKVTLNHFFGGFVLTIRTPWRSEFFYPHMGSTGWLIFSLESGMFLCQATGWVLGGSRWSAHFHSNKRFFLGKMPMVEVTSPWFLGDVCVSCNTNQHKHLPKIDCLKCPSCFFLIRKEGHHNFCVCWCFPSVKRLLGVM